MLLGSHEPPSIAGNNHRQRPPPPPSHRPPTPTPTHLCLGQVAKREERARQLLLAKVGQEVGLVLDFVGSEGQLHRAAPRRPHQPRVVPRGHPVKAAAVCCVKVLVESAKLDPATTIDGPKYQFISTF